MTPSVLTSAASCSDALLGSITVSFQRSTVPSSLPVAVVFPAGLYTTLKIVLVCPVTVCRGAVFASHKRMVGARLPVRKTNANLELDEYHASTK